MLIAKHYVTYIRNAVKNALDEILEKIKSNIIAGNKYIWTRFPDDEPKRKPFTSVIDDWFVSGDSIKASWWWKIHIKGGTFYPKFPKKVFAIPYKNRVFFGRKIVIPQRNPLPTSEQIEGIVRKHLKRGK